MGAKVDWTPVKSMPDFKERLKMLKPRNQQVMAMRYGVYGEPATFESIGATFNITRERVRQIIRRSWQIMRGPYQRKMFRDSIKEELRSGRES